MEISGVTTPPHASGGPGHDHRHKDVCAGTVTDTSQCQRQDGTQMMPTKVPPISSSSSPFPRVQWNFVVESFPVHG